MRHTQPSTPSRFLLPGFLLLAMALGACASAPPAPVPVEPAVGEITASTRWFAAAAEQEAAFRQTYLAATRAIEAIAAERDPGSWAVVVDVDDTALDNVAYQVWLDRTGRAYTTPSWNDWVRKEAAVALPGVVSFLERVREVGGIVALVSNRLEEVRDATESNLRREGILWDLLLLKTDTSDKEPRFRAIEEGTASPDLPPLPIALWVGDNIEDFPGLSQAVRGADAESFAGFGRRYFVLPNPTYGSWQGNPLPERLRED